MRHIAKTVAVNVKTWERMRKLLDSGEARTLDELIRRLMDQSLRLPESMFGVDRSEEYGSLRRNTKKSLKMSTRPAAHADAANESLINFERKKKVDGWGMADSIVLATGRRSKARVVAEDPHFRDLTNESITL